MDVLDRFAEHKDWVLKYDPVADNWIVCIALIDRNSWRVIGRGADVLSAIKQALAA